MTVRVADPEYAEPILHALDAADRRNHLVVHPPPHTTTPRKLGTTLLVALGKRFDTTRREGLEAPPSTSPEPGSKGTRSPMYTSIETTQ